MAKSFNTLRKNMSQRAQAQAKRKTKQLLDAMSLQALRQNRAISQEELAIALATKQANISRLERRADMHISTLRDYINAMGGELELIARFPEGDVSLNQFDSE